MSFRYPGGLLTTTGPVNAQYPSGVWTQQQVAPYQAQGVFASDPQFRYTTLLLNGNGTNGAQNNTFLDSSTNAFTVTRNGNATQGTFSPYIPDGYWSNYFDGSSTLTAGAATPPTALQLGSSDFTVEAWIYVTSTSTAQYIISNLNDGSGVMSWVFNVNGSTGAVTFGFGVDSNYLNNVIITSSSNAFTLNTWAHVAVTRSGSTFRLFGNGTQVGTATNASTIYSASQQFTIGAAYSGQYKITGYISNLRVVKGTALYTSAFTPSTAPLTAVANTSLLTCQSNRFLDNSSNAFAVAVGASSVSAQAFQPFPRTTASSAAVTGGSGYFDGSGDYLSVADNAALEPGSGNFTLECWFYVPSGSTVSANGRTLLSKSNTSSFGPFNIGFNPSTGKLEGLSSTSGSNWEISCSATQTYTTLKGAWHHVAYVRNGSAFTLYIDGVSAATATSSSALVNNTDSFMVGYINYPSTYFDGYITNARLVIGTAVYTGTFTPPTSPLTAISGTSLLCNMTNAGIQDSTMGNDLETVGNAQVSTSVVKYGTGSIKTGSGNYLIATPPTPFLQIPTSSDFTFEYWVYVNSFLDSNYNLAFGMNSKNYCGVAASKVFLNGDTDPESVFATTINTGTWYHVAFSRSSGTLRAFVNGTQVGSNVSETKSYFTQQNYLVIGAMNGNSFPLNGYLDDLRITKGYARYTANFTPPIAPFPKQ